MFPRPAGRLLAVAEESPLPVDAEALFAARFVDSAAPQALLDSSGHVLLVNAALCQLLGRTVEALLGTHFSELAHGSDDGDLGLLLRRLTRARGPVRANAVLGHLDGSPIPVFADGAVATGRDGRRALSLAVHDLRELLGAQEKLRQQQLFLSALGEQARDAAFVTDADGTLLYVSPAVTTMFGYEPNGLVGCSGWDFVHPDDLPLAQKAYAAVIERGGTHRLTFRVRTAAGAWAWVEETATNLLHTPIAGVVCNLVDVTERREAERRLAREQARNRAIVEAAHEGVWVIGCDGRTEYVNPCMAELLGLSTDFLRTGQPLELTTTRPDAVSLAIRIRDRARRGPERYEVAYAHPDGGRRWFSVSSAPVAFDDGAFSGCVAMVSDITEARRLQHELRHAALHDQLTGLPNRALLDDRLEQAALAHHDEDAARLSLLWLDIDEFKLVNDSRGHAVGDRVLVELSRRLVQEVGPTDTVARPGGDEFIVLLPGADLAAAEALAARLLEGLREPILVDDYPVHLSASIGVASAPPREAAALLRRADSALLAAKAGGRGRARCFDPSLAAEAEAALDLATDLRAAIAGDELELHYQPIVSLPTGRTIGYEALARWTHPVHGRIAPDSFVDLAERVGLSRDLDAWALRRAASDLASIPSSGAGDEPYVSVNVSAINLGSPEIEQLLVRATDENGISPHRIALEITERSLMRDVERSGEVLRRLRDRGHPIAVDDFGIGYSSLSYLRDFPITTIKIDRTFVGPAVTDVDAAAIVASIIQIAQAIGATTVAEGIETQEHAARFAQLGCSAGQGWWWAPATPLAELPGLRSQFPPVRRRPERRRPSARLEELSATHGLERIIELQREGASPATIAAALNAEGYRTPRGQRWQWMGVTRVLVHLQHPGAPARGAGR